MNEHDLLRAAQAGDDDAFASLVDPYRPELLAHCYRMLGSAVDAEDALQDALVDAWRGLAGFEGRSSLRSWLYTVTTNACLKVVRRRPTRVLPVDYGGPADPHDRATEPLLESVWLEPYPDEGLRYEERESVELAFVAALQHLPARQRAVLLLREVLGFSAREVAEMLDTSPASIDSALQRAHRTVEARVPEPSQHATLRALGDDQLREIVDRYVSAWERHDVDALVSMLTSDACFTMPPWREWYAGRDKVAEFLASGPLRAETRWRVVPTTANGQLAFGLFDWDEGSARYLPHALSIITLDARGAITEITVFRTADAFTRFELPEQVLDTGDAR
ncbi:MAG TPA: sigma-70 family RNA polymerase sigma factor [Acidimicrobiia bacterium]|nr:sigma-70 family RNA polymerase sigma factor [Acidimicrobiia bacterium]